MCMYAGVFYVSHTENVCFRLAKRTFHGWKTYGSRMENVKTFHHVTQFNEAFA